MLYTFYVHVQLFIFSKRKILHTQIISLPWNSTIMSHIIYIWVIVMILIWSCVHFTLCCKFANKQEKLFCMYNVHRVVQCSLPLTCQLSNCYVEGIMICLCTKKNSRNKGKLYSIFPFAVIFLKHSLFTSHSLHHHQELLIVNIKQWKSTHLSFIIAEASASAATNRTVTEVVAVVVVWLVTEAKTSLHKSRGQ